MTDQHLTTSQLLARHDAQQRSRAQAAGRPLDRTTFPGMTLAGEVGAVIFTRNDGLHVAHGDGTVAALDFAALRIALAYAFALPPRKGEPGYGQPDVAVTVVADQDTFKALVRQAGRWATRRDTLEAAHMARLLSFRAGLPWSAYLPILTEGLGSRYWLPAGLAPDSVDDWCTAFGIAPGRGFDTFDQLIALACQGTDRGKYLTAAARSERFSSNSARSTADHSASAAFNGAGLIADAHAAMVATDPLLVPRNRIAGTISAIRIHQIRAKYIEAMVTGVGKLRPDSRILAFTAEGGRPVEATLGEVAFRNDTFSVKILAENGVIRGRSRAEGNPALKQAHADGHTVYITAAPFLMVKKRPKNRRWSNNFDGEPKRHHVDIPPDVALAGAPMEAAG